MPFPELPPDTPLDTASLTLALAAPPGSRLRANLAHAGAFLSGAGGVGQRCDGFDPQPIKSLFEAAYTRRELAFALNALEDAIACCRQSDPDCNLACSAAASAAS